MVFLLTGGYNEPVYTEIDVLDTRVCGVTERDSAEMRGVGIFYFGLTILLVC